jgi:hypothetical protein
MNAFLNNRALKTLKASLLVRAVNKRVQPFTGFQMFDIKGPWQSGLHNGNYKNKVSRFENRRKKGRR